MASEYTQTFHHDYAFDRCPYPKDPSSQSQLMTPMVVPQEPLFLDATLGTGSKQFHFGQLIVPTHEEVLPFLSGEIEGETPAQATVDDAALRQILVPNNDNTYHVRAGDKNESQRYLDPNVQLTMVPQDNVPYILRGPRCLNVPRTVPSEAIACGTRIPAGLHNVRAIVLGHLVSEGNVHYFLCLHGIKDVLLLRAHSENVVGEWPAWSYAAQIYTPTVYRDVFEREGATLYQRMFGIYLYYDRRQKEHLVDTEIRPAESSITARSAFSRRAYLLWDKLRCVPSVASMTEDELRTSFHTAPSTHNL